MSADAICRHKFSSRPGDVCGIQVAMTEYGPDHVTRPRVHHRPFTTTAPVGHPGSAVGAGTGVSQPPRGTAPVRRSIAG